MTVETEPQGSRRGILAIGLGLAIAALTAAIAMARRSMEREARIQMSLTIDRPIDEVFDFIADARNVLKWLPSAVERRKLTEGPIGTGTRFEGTDRIGRGLVTHTQEIIGYEPGRSVTTRMSEPWNGDYEIRLQPTSEGTLLSVDTSGRLTGPARWFNLVPDRAMSKMFERDYRRLKALLEGEREPLAISIEPEAGSAIAEAESVMAEAEELAAR